MGQLLYSPSRRLGVEYPLPPGLGTRLTDQQDESSLITLCPRSNSSQLEVSTDRPSYSILSSAVARM